MTDFAQIKTGNMKKRIKVLGVGSGACMIINKLHSKKPNAVTLTVIDSDITAIKYNNSNKKIQLGKTHCLGLGCGGFPEKGAKAVQESIPEIKDHLKDTDVAIICACIGGGTGTGATPTIIKLAKDMGIQIIVIVTTPHKTEKKRLNVTKSGIETFSKKTDNIIIFDNNETEKFTEGLDIEQRFDVMCEIIANRIKTMIEKINHNNISDIN